MGIEGRVPRGALFVSSRKNKEGHAANAETQEKIVRICFLVSILHF